MPAVPRHHRHPLTSQRMPGIGNFYFCWKPAGMVLQCATDFKDYFGLDQCQARLYTAIARHIVLVMAALAICAVAAALLRGRTGTQAPPPGSPGQPPPADPGLVPLTVPEIKRITAALTARPLPAPLVIHWDAWTRRHQARARWFHQRARLKRDYALVS
jgi:hypothetical protein